MKSEYDFSKSERGRFCHKNSRLSLPACGPEPAWEGPNGRLGKFIEDETKKTLEAYKKQLHLINEHANHEHGTSRGGYANRQLFELVQNSADALRHSPHGKTILVRLTEDFLYCADDGVPVDEEGITALMFARMSGKGSDMIGKFGLGFKSVLGVTDAPEFYSRPVSFRFDKKRAAERLKGVNTAERLPVLRLPEPFDPIQEREEDEDLRELMSWAINIVRLPLKLNVFGKLVKQMQDFPPEFLLVATHVRYLTLEISRESQQQIREFMLDNRQGSIRLDTNDGSAQWRRFQTTHHLSPEARSD